ncbi:MAG: hypothetical protein ACQKBT_01520, partial [Puniceicoccales bacterium]
GPSGIGRRKRSPYKHDTRAKPASIRSNNQQHTQLPCRGVACDARDDFRRDITMAWPFRNRASQAKPLQTRYESEPRRNSPFNPQH